MSLMLANVIGNYLDTLSERELDAPFMALLRALGFYEIHNLHGIFEFGKDFIAKRIETDGLRQYVFQTKRGDITAGGWRDVRNQLDDAWRTSLAHPNFDADAPREVVIVLTGKFVGGAQLSSQEYSKELAKQGVGFTVWERENLIEKCTGVGPSGVALIDLTRVGKFLQLLGAIKENTSCLNDVYDYYCRCLVATCDVGKRIWENIIEWALLAHEFRLNNRDFEAYACCRYASNTCWYHYYAMGNQDKEASNLLLQAIECCESLASDYAELVIDSLEDRLGNSPSWFDEIGINGFVTLPVRYLQALELLSLEGIKHRIIGDSIRANRCRQLVCMILDNCPAAYHPISESYASSIWIVGAFLLLMSDQKRTERLIRETGIWVVDRYVKGFGLADVWAKPEEEISTLFGFCFSFVNVERRDESFIAPVLLELASISGFLGLYNDLLNDLNLANIVLPFLQLRDSRNQFSPDAIDSMWIGNVDYPEPWPDDTRWPVTPHQRNAVTTWKFRDRGFPWIAFQNTLCNRDRFYPGVLSELLPERVPQ